MNFLFIIISVLSLFKLMSADKFVDIDGYRYYISYPLTKNWYQADRFCTYHNMNLIDIPTSEENERVKRLINIEEYQTEPYFWTSGVDLGTEGSFYWSTTGHPMLYTDWVEGQPDNTNNSDHCAEIRGTCQYRWNDDNCLAQKSFICRDRVLLPEKQKCPISVNQPDPINIKDEDETSDIDIRSLQDDLDRPRFTKRDDAVV